MKSMQGKNFHNCCKWFAKCQCAVYKLQSFCNNGCDTCKRNRAYYTVNYCSDYKLSVQSAKEVVSDVSLKNELSNNRHSFEYKRALNNFINSL